MSLWVPAQGMHVFMLAWELQHDRDCFSVITSYHPGVPHDYYSFRGAAGIPEEAASLFDDTSHFAHTYLNEQLYGLSDVLNLQLRLPT